MEQMTYGITGNTAKDELWPLIQELRAQLDQNGIQYQLHSTVARGLAERSLVSAEDIKNVSSDTLAQTCDLILSIGGDGTLLHTAFEVGSSGIPILGINIGNLGFLADVEATRIQDALLLLSTKQYTIENRSALSLSGPQTGWAFNDIVITRQPAEGLAAIDVLVDGIRLNRYWGDGLIISTPTGSTALFAISWRPDCHCREVM